jgi:phosphate transport system substrate-binding protein
MQNCISFWRLYVVLLIVFAVSCAKKENTIRVKGSDTEVNLSVLLAESFHRVDPDLMISIAGGGSGLGIASLLNNTADVANSSRTMKDAEWEIFRLKGIEVDSFIFALDAIAFVVSAEMPFDSISIADLSGILNGGIKNWSDLHGEDMPINIYGRQSNSGTHEFIKNRLNLEFSPRAKQMNGNAQIIEAIKSDPSGIGYVGAGYVSHRPGSGIKVLNIYTGKNQIAISPFDTAMIAAGKYFFQRPLFQYFRKNSFQKIKPLLEFEGSEEGRKIISLSGYYPVKK